MIYRENAKPKQEIIRAPINWPKYYMPAIRLIRIIFALPVFVLWLVAFVPEHAFHSLFSYIFHGDQNHWPEFGFTFEKKDSYQSWFWKWYWTGQKPND